MLMPGTLFTMVADDPEMSEFFADRGALVATTTHSGPAPYRSKLLRASSPSGPWKVVFEDDARFMVGTVATGRFGFIEYREEPLSGGAHSETVMVVDFASGATTKVDNFALSAKTFHGGGGGPRGPSWALALDTDWIAWTRLNELPGGVREGELRIARLSAVGSFTTIGRSREWIQPISIDERSLVYIVGGTERDDLRIRDLATGSERSLTQMLAPTQSAGRGAVARSGAWVGWIDTPPMTGAPDAKPNSAKTAIFRAVNVETGELRERVLATSSCNAQFSGNGGYFAWDCRAGPGVTMRVFDPNSWSERDLVTPAPGVGMSTVAVEGGFLLLGGEVGVRRIALFTLAPP